MREKGWEERSLKAHLKNSVIILALFSGLSIANAKNFWHENLDSVKRHLSQEPP